MNLRRRPQPWQPDTAKENYNPKGVMIVVVIPMIAVMSDVIAVPVPDMI